MKISGFDEISDEFAKEAQNMRDAAEEADDLLEDTLRTLARELQGDIERKAPRSNPTRPQDKRDGEEHLEDTIEVTKLGKRKFKVEVTSDYGVYVEYGTATQAKKDGPTGGSKYPITPNTADELVFYDDAGAVVRTQGVMHPGREPNPFFRPAVEEHEEVFRRTVKEEFRKFLEDNF